MKYFSGLFISFLFSLSLKSQKFTLFDSGKTDFVIFIQTNASPVEKKAADTLKYYLDKASGSNFPVHSKYPPSENFIWLVYEPDPGFFPDEPKLTKHADRYRISVQKKYLHIIGGEKGLLYAVYDFLEKFIGYRFYAGDAFITPQQKKCELQYPYSEQAGNVPRFRLNYNGNAFQPHYALWHKLDNELRRPGFAMNSQWGLFVHTMFKLVPPEIYFDKYSEYYSLRNGVRTKDQLCLTNPEVLKITIDSLRAQISRNPAAKYWSVSQMDNYNFCECDNCKKADAVDGSATGSIIQFVNKVAEAFPDKMISTLAYQYSRKSPLKTKPAPNVNIMLCTIECDRSKPIEADKGKGSFYDDLKNWSALTKNIIVWDYVINFSNTCSPFPNLHVLKPNLKLFNHFGVKMHFQQGWPSYGGEMEELRTYLISKLLWNPDINMDSVKNDFLSGYYEGAAPFIKNILDTMEIALKKSGKPLLIYEHPFTHRDDYLSPELMKFYHEQIARAVMETATNSKVLKRVDKFAQAFRYADIEVAKMMINTGHWIFEKTKDSSLAVKPYYDSLLNEFADKCKMFGPPVLHETSLPPEQYKTNTVKYFNTAIEKHLAVGAKLIFKELYNQQYSANGPQSLVDGIHGFEKWEVLWQGWWGKDITAIIDLGKTKTIRLVKMNFMDDNQSWIMAPASFTVETSTDGKTFTKTGTVKNPKAGDKLEKQIVPLELKLSKPVQAKFIRVTVKNIGKLPAWRGVNGDAWIFTDEIVVK